MKRFPVRHGVWIVGLLLGLSWGTIHAADVMDDLESFRKKVAETETKASPDYPMRGPQLSGQIKQLENLISHDDDRALQALEGLNNFGLPPPLQDEWQRISMLLGPEIEKRRAGRLEKWAASIDQLVKDTRKTCLEAKVSDELDPLLLRCSAVQMQAERSNSVMMERLNRKLQGVAQTLTAWTSYLDYQNTKDAKKANEALRSLAASNSHYPILTMKDIESRIVDVTDAQTDIHIIAAKVFADINSPDDLPKALERLQSYSHNPLNQQANPLGMEVAHVTAYIDAWKAAQAGDVTTAAAALSRNFGGFEDIQRFYVPLKAQIEARFIKDKAASWTKLSQNPGEPAHVYFGRILEDLKERGEYPAMLEVMTFAGQVDRTAPSLFTATDRQSIEQFLAGQRFEKVGDGLAAVTSYRLVIGLPSGKYTPVDKAQEALKGLQAKYPEAFKNYEGVLLEQIRGLSQQLQILQNRPPGMPYPMGNPYRPQ